MSDLFKATHCDRCKKELGSARKMSRFNLDTLCIECAEKEREHPDYKKAVEADRAEIKRGNWNFEGIGYREVNE